MKISKLLPQIEKKANKLSNLLSEAQQKGLVVKINGVVQGNSLEIEVTKEESLLHFGKFDPKARANRIAIFFGEFRNRPESDLEGWIPRPKTHHLKNQSKPDSLVDS